MRRVAALDLLAGPVEEILCKDDEAGPALVGAIGQVWRQGDGQGQAPRTGVIGSAPRRCARPHHFLGRAGDEPGYWVWHGGCCRASGVAGLLRRLPALARRADDQGPQGLFRGRPAAAAMAEEKGGGGARGRFGFDEWTDGELRDWFIAIIGRGGSKNNTYKFAMARFLLDLCCDPSMMQRMYGRPGDGDAPGAIDTADGIKVKYAEIARYFFVYYWPIVCRARLEQGPDGKDPLVAQIIKKEFRDQEYRQSACQIIQEEPEKVERCIEAIAKVMPRQVVHRFQKVGGKEIRMFYQYGAGDEGKGGNRPIDLRGGILVSRSAARFLRENYGALDRTVAHEWLRFTDLRNPGATNLAGRFLKAYGGCEGACDFLPGLESGGRFCFYCGARPDQGERMYVDHFLPEDYLRGTKEWNLVLACQECGPKKVRMLPPRECIGMLERRNAKRREEEAPVMPLGKMTRSERGLARHYENARKQGYPVAESLQAACT